MPSGGHGPGRLLVSAGSSTQPARHRPPTQPRSRQVPGFATEKYENAERNPMVERPGLPINHRVGGEKTPVGVPAVHAYSLPIGGSSDCTQPHGSANSFQSKAKAHPNSRPTRNCALHFHPKRKQTRKPRTREQKQPEWISVISVIPISSPLPVNSNPCESNSAGRIEPSPVPVI